MWNNIISLFRNHMQVGKHHRRLLQVITSYPRSPAPKTRALFQAFRPWLEDVQSDPGWHDFQALIEESLGWPDDDILWLRARDGKRLAMRAYLPSAAFQGTVIHLHALTLHSKYYRRFGHELADAGMATFCLDIRGHGMSEGRRGDCARPHLFLEDLELVHTTLEGMYPGKPVIWVGHSLGAMLWWKMLSETNLRPDALVSIGAGPVSAAILSLWRTRRLMLWPRWLRLLTDGPGPGARFIRVLIPPLPTDHGQVLNYTPRFFLSALPWRLDPVRIPPEVPILAVIGGRDQAYDARMVGDFIARLPGDATLHVYPDADHLNIIRAGSASIIQWLSQKVSLPRAVKHRVAD